MVSTQHTSRHVERSQRKRGRSTDIVATEGTLEPGSSKDCTAEQNAPSAVAFSTPIRTKNNTYLSSSIGTLAEALAAIEHLPLNKQVAQRWQKAGAALLSAAERPGDAALVEVAAGVLRRALLEEGWLC